MRDSVFQEKPINQLHCRLAVAEIGCFLYFNNPLVWLEHVALDVTMLRFAEH